MKELVRYHNDFNKIRLPGFTAQEQDILMSLISKIRDRPQGEILTFTAAEIAEFGRKNATLKAQTSVINSLKTKFFKADFTILLEFPEQNLYAEETINLFKKLTIFYLDKEHTEIDHIELSVNEMFSYLVDNLMGNFSSFELPEFLELSSKYAKTLYRLLKQWRSTGKCLTYAQKWDEFREYMNTPKSYKQAHIDRQILLPAIAELTPIFPNLRYEKKKDPKGRGRGGKVIGIEFYFDAQEAKQEQENTSTASDKNLISSKHIKQESKNTSHSTASKPASKNKQQTQLNERAGLFGAITHELSHYVYRHFHSWSDKLQDYEICKIMSIHNNQLGGIQVSILNQDSGNHFTREFDSIKHFENWFEKLPKD